MLEENRKTSKRQKSFIQSGGMTETSRFAPTGYANPVQIAACLKAGIGIFFAVPLFIKLFLYYNLNILFN